MLIKRYGKDSVVFINGDEILDDLDYGDELNELQELHMAGC